MRISVEGPTLAKWDAVRAVQLWWNNKTRRIPTKDTHDYHRQPSSSSEATEGSSSELADWDSWFKDSDSSPDEESDVDT